MTGWMEGYLPSYILEAGTPGSGKCCGGWQDCPASSLGEHDGTFSVNIAHLH